MYITFNNKNSLFNVLLEYNNSTYKILAEQSLDLPVTGKTCVFSVTLEALSQDDALKEEKPTTFAGKIIQKITGKLVNTVSRFSLNPQVTYELDCDNDSAVIDLLTEEWSEFDGDVAMLIFDTYPIMRSFCRAESENATLRVTQTKNTNLRKFLKTARLFLLFFQQTSVLLGLLLFLPYYIVIRYFASDFHFSRVLKRLYNMDVEQREKALKSNREKLEFEDSFGGCLKFLLILVLVTVAAVVIGKAILTFTEQ